ncbi:MAG: type IV pilus modification PilV family protein [Desulfosalsimonas sp.]
MKHNSEAGFTLIEVLIAMAIFAVGLLALGIMQAYFAEGNAKSRQLIRATDIGLSKIEELAGADKDDDILDPDLNTHEDDESRSLDYEIKWDVTKKDTDTGEQILLIDLWVEWKTGDLNHKVSFDWIRPK